MARCNTDLDRTRGDPGTLTQQCMLQQLMLVVGPGGAATDRKHWDVQGNTATVTLAANAPLPSHVLQMSSRLCTRNTSIPTITGLGHINAIIVAAPPNLPGGLQRLGARATRCVVTYLSGGPPPNPPLWSCAANCPPNPSPPCTPHLTSQTHILPTPHAPGSQSATGILGLSSEPTKAHLLLVQLEARPETPAHRAHDFADDALRDSTLRSSSQQCCPLHC